MIVITVTQENIDFAKKQIEEFTKTEAGSWRYSGVEAWRGIVCEIITSKWLEKNYEVTKPAKGLDTSGITDDYDVIINGYKIEIKSATKNYFKYLMPKIHDVQTKPKDFYIGTKYNETVEPNQVQVIGYITRDEILKYPIKKNKGAPYYEIPLSALQLITPTSF